jgi:hypothetical protein
MFGGGGDGPFGFLHHDKKMKKDSPSKGGGDNDGSATNINKNRKGKKDDQQQQEYMLESLRYWDVTMPPVHKYMVAGHLVPSVKNAFSHVSFGTLNKRRRITVELYKKIDLRRSSVIKTYQDRRIHQTLFPEISDNDNTNTATSQATTQSLDDDDLLIFRILKPTPINSKDSDNDDDDASMVSYPRGRLDAHTLTTFSIDDYGDGYDEHNTTFKWRERFRCKTEKMEILEVHARSLEVQLGIGDETVVRELLFDSIQDADTFMISFDKIRQLQRERGMRLAAAHGSMRSLLLGDSETTATTNDHTSGGGNVIKSRGLAIVPEDEAIETSLHNTTPDNHKQTQRSSPKKAGGGLMGIFRKKPPPSLPSELNILIEIVSASNLPVAGTSKDDD